MPSNGGGRTVYRVRPDSYYFDKLPLTVRCALTVAAFNWSSSQIYRLWRRGGGGFRTEAEIVRSIGRWDAEEIRMEQRKAVRTGRA
jgi:Family of unknown function (DUF6525)